MVRQFPARLMLFRKRPKPKPMEAAPDLVSWKDWFDAYGPKLLLCARHWTRSLADAEDAVQEPIFRPLLQPEGA